jgi:hypothetical protein
MNERIRELAISKGIFDSLCDPFDELKNGDCYSSVIIDLERFAELIVEECISVVDYDDGATHVRELLLEHFGSKE